MSMTDGQWILDMNIFKDTMRPAVSTGLSVTRVGGVGQNKRQKGLAAALNKTLAGYRQAEEYAHFGTELSPEAQADYDKGKALFLMMNQDIGEGYSLMDQQFLLDVILNSKPGEKIDIKKMKELVKEYSPKVVEDKDTSNFETLRDELKALVLISGETKDPKHAAAAAPSAEGDTKSEEAIEADTDNKDKKSEKEQKESDDKKEDKKDHDKKDEHKDGDKKLTEQPAKEAVGAGDKK
jgi:hypothetical protein